MDGEVEVGLVGEDEGAGEEEADGEDGADEEVLGDVDVFGAVEETSCALEDAGADCLKRG